MTSNWEWSILTSKPKSCIQRVLVVWRLGHQTCSQEIARLSTLLSDNVFGQVVLTYVILSPGGSVISYLLLMLYCWKINVGPLGYDLKSPAGWLPRDWDELNAAPHIWNMLPPHLKNINVSREKFKLGVKLWLFVQAYSYDASWELCLSGALQILDLIDWLNSHINWPTFAQRLYQVRDLPLRLLSPPSERSEWRR